jgi:two-component system NtrC family sensor kinase
VASRWRIRHKLMLGLGLVVTTMVLLVGGTVRGLVSYYLDMVNLRLKTSQLRKAEDVKAAVGDIARLAERLKYPRSAKPEELRPFRPEDVPESDPLALPGEGDEAASEKREPANMLEAIDRAGNKLLVFEEGLKESAGQDLSTGSEDALAYVSSLRERFQKLRQSLDERKPDKKKEPSPWDGAGMFPSAGDEQVDGEMHRARDEQIKGIERDARDLCNIIHGSIHQRIEGSRKNYQNTMLIAIPASVVGLLVVCGLLGSFYGWVFHPIRDLESGVVRVAGGDFSHRIELHSGDEMEDLGHAFNNMMQRLQSLYSDLARQVNERSRQLVRSERLASVGFLAAGVAHEINNPLASIAFCSEALEARLGDLLRHTRANGRFDEEHEIFSKYLKMIQEEAFRCKNITERLLAFSRPGERRREKTDLRELVQLVLDVTQHLPNHRGKEIRFEMNPERISGGSSIAAWVNAEEIKQVMLNLVVNALDSMDEGGRLTIRLGQRDDMAELQFTDTGCGMTPEVLDNIFEPFYTRSRTGKGTGLGLTISHLIITQHDGEIEATSPGPNQGSTFVVRLPMSAPEVASGPPDPGRGESPAPAPARMPQARAA